MRIWAAAVAIGRKLGEEIQIREGEEIQISIEEELEILEGDEIQIGI